MFRLFCLLALTSLGSAFAADRSSSPDGAYVYFISPADGETVQAHTLVRFGLAGMGVAPAGVERTSTGHHHLLINQDELPPADEPMPANDTLLHFGAGQTEAWVDLPPGKHRLQLVLGNHLHVQHKPVIKSAVITVTVLPPPQDEKKKEEKPGLPGLFR